MLLADIPNESLWSKDARIGRLPIVLDLPVSDENYKRRNPFVQTAIFLDNPIHFFGILASLCQAIFFLREFSHK